jgi:probable HAF family extracellular repeat protein
MSDLGTLGGSNSWAYGINASGQVVGMSDTRTRAQQAFLYSNGTMTNLGSLSGENGGSSASGINASGQIVGASSTNNGYGHAFLYSDGTMTDLGTLPGGTQSYANGINASGQVVGESMINGWDHPFLYSNGTMTDLNTLIAPTSGWYLEEATAINDLGQIVGFGYNSQGQTHAFLLTTVPEPSSFVLLGIGAISLLGYAWRRKQRS